MLDRYNRNISYLRISVTDRCNLRCTYCIPSCTTTFFRTDELLTIKEIVNVVKTGVSFGISKIRLTGGEPLVRYDIIEIVNKISRIPEVKDLSMTTNGILLEKFALPLKQAGLNRVNISLDTIDNKLYNTITRGGNLGNVLKGIEAAQKAGLNPVKINAVKFPEIGDKESNQLGSFCYKRGLQLRFIRQMNLETGEFYEVEGGEGGICEICNRLRLTANGMVKPCLFGNLEYSIRELGILKAMEIATANKPSCGVNNKINKFYNIGG